MKPQFVIIAILIILKVIGVAGRANAASDLPGYTFDDCHNQKELQLINTFTNPTYRCGQTPNYKWI